MKNYKAFPNPHSNPQNYSEADANLFGFFKLLWDVDRRNKRKEAEISLQNKKEELEK